MTAYYNEFDPGAAAWLRELIKRGLIPDGDVDTRDMREVQASELRGYTQHHFFAGIGGWAYALRLAGWPDDRPVLTGSPPCQPFSSAGKQLGAKDERHLAPHFLELVAALRPAWVFGEQVAAAIKKDDWLDDLLDALEAEGYTTGAAVLPACGVGSPHIRQRLWFTGRFGDTTSPGRREGVFTQSGDGKGERREKAERSDEREETRGGCATGRLAHTDCAITKQSARQGPRPDEAESTRPCDQPYRRGDFGGMASPIDTGSQGRIPRRSDTEREGIDRRSGRDSATGRLAEPDSRQCNRKPEHGQHEQHGQAGGRQQRDSESTGGGSGCGMADAESNGRKREPHINPAGVFGAAFSEAEPRQQPGAHSTGAGGMADSESKRFDRREDPAGQGGRVGAEEFCGACGMADSESDRDQEIGTVLRGQGPVDGRGMSANTPTHAPSTGWDDPDWLFCRDGKWRPVEPGTFPLAHGVSARVGRLRGYGNAIVPQVAAEVIRTMMEETHA